MSIDTNPEKCVPEHLKTSEQWHRRQARIFSHLGYSTLLLTGLPLLMGLVADVMFPFIQGYLPAYISYGAVTTFVPLYIITVPIVFWMLRRKDFSSLHKRALPVGFYIKLCVVAFGVVYIGNYLSLGLSSLLTRSGLPTTNPVETLLGSVTIWEAVIYTVIAAPVAEELIFRKGMISLLIPYGEETAILVSALFFALVHANLYQLIYAFGLGCVLGYLYVKSGRLRDVVAVHALINFVGGILPLLLTQSIDDAFLDRVENFSQMLEQAPTESMQVLTEHLVPLLGLLFLSFLTVFSIIGTAVVLLRNRKAIRFKPGHSPLQKGYRFKTIFLNSGTILSVLFYITLVVAGVLWNL